MKRVRWKQGPGWRYGRLDGQAEADGSVRVWEDFSGGARSLPLLAVQQQTEGPRGGHRWEWMSAEAVV